MGAQMRILVLLILLFAAAPMAKFAPAEAAGPRMDDNGGGP
jgi:hypothetical protein